MLLLAGLKIKTMKSILIIVSILTTLVCTAQKMTSWDDITSQHFGKETIYKNGKQKLLKGYYKVTSSDGNYAEITFKKGKINGLRKDYNSNGQLRNTRFYKDGKADGEWRYFTNEGDVKTIENYYDGEKSGKWWKKMKSRNIIYITETFYEKGIPRGIWTKKREDSLLLEETTYTKKGTYTKKEYRENGKLRKQSIFKNFKLNGEQLEYSKSDVLLSKLVFANDIIQRKETYYKNGRPDETYQYKNGKPDGYCVDYKRSGVKSYEGTYNMGNKEGVFKKYFGEEGWLYYETTYKEDVENGAHKTYYRNKKIEQEGSYLNGFKQGVWKYYNIDGALKREVTYDRDTEVSRKE